MNTQDKDGWLSVIGQFNSANDLLNHHAHITRYMKDIAEASKNAKAVLVALEKRAATLALGDDPNKTDAEYTCGVVQKVEKTVHSVVDWDLYYAWIAEDPQNRMQGFLHKKEGVTAIGRHLEDSGELPPGCETRILTDIKVKSALPQLGEST